MRLLTLLVLIQFCTCVRAQTSRIDTVNGPLEGYVTYRFITEMPASEAMGMAELFMRGRRHGEPAEPWDRLDSLVVIDPDGERVEIQNFNHPQSENVRAANPYFDQDVVILEGDVGEVMTHQIVIYNPTDFDREFQRTDGESVIKTKAEKVAVSTKGKAAVFTELLLPAGASTRVVRYEDKTGAALEVRMVLSGHDLDEGDFIVSKNKASLSPWIIPAGRETLYLRLRSTEKLMTIYKEGERYTKVAVGRQLDELNLSGLGIGDYLLEVIDLGSGERRYHGLRRLP